MTMLNVVVILITIIPLIKGQCSGETCSECIRSSPSCQWCKKREYSDDRCQSIVTVNQVANCDGEWVKPKSTYKGDTSNFSNLVQVQPTAITLKLRPGEEKNVTLVVKPSADYPLDLYYLMDFSYSMNDDLEELKKKATSISGALKDISSNFRIGFGTFVDKPTSPYANTEGNSIEKPCDICQAVHSFNHEMSLKEGDSANTEFKTKLDSLKISSNIDNPEGGFDAIVQASVCKNEIGWRSQSRKVIFYASDAVFHTAGDGKLAGIVKSNSGTCGMTNNKYARSLQEDYPSIGQINDILIKNNIMPVFAVTSSMQSLYKELTNQLTQLSSVGQLSDNSDEVATLIKKQLEALVATTKVNPQAPTGVTVDVKPKCSGKQVPTEQGCGNVKTDEEVKFDLIFKVDQCTDGDNKYKFSVDVPGIASVNVSIEMICDCECEKDKSEIEIDSKQCNEVGDLICGGCKCKKGAFGDRCQCDQTTDVGVVNCTNPDTNLICGGENNGRCICGQCECLPPNKQGHRRWGKYCECSNYECPRNLDYEICSNNGYCDCGVCKCNKKPNGMDKSSNDPEYTGKDCGCPVSQETCKHPDTGVKCSDKGTCQCGQCVCKKDHYGQFCDICQDCGPLDCSKYVECVKCVYLQDKPIGDCNCTVETSKSIGERVDTSKLGRHKQCLPIDDPKNEGCSIIYYLHYNDRGFTQQPQLLEILIDREPDCPSAPNVIAIVAGVIGGILGVGILLLICWKIFTSIMDKREYAKFLEERSRAKWNSGLSPLYKEPMTKYVNPLYTAAASRI